MQKKSVKTSFLNSILFPNLPIKLLIALCIGLLIPLTYWFVWCTGGIKYVFSHTMYLPIILAGLFWGLEGSIPIALICGFLLGPLMPIDTVTGEKQLVINWLFRLVLFLVISITVGVFSGALKKYILQLRFISIHNSDTGLLNNKSIDVDPEIQHMLRSAAGDVNIIAISWNNIDDIVNLFGTEICVKLIREMQRQLENMYADRLILIQFEISKLYVIVKDPDGDHFLWKTAKFFENPFIIDGIPYYVSVTLGLCPYRESGDGLSSFQKANIASIHSKKKQIAASTINDTLISTTRRNLHLLSEFPHALSSDQLTLYYQPKYDLKTHETISVEALIRWNHPERGFITPQDFIPIIEESHLINPLTEWVLTKGLAKLKQFAESGLNTSISINISSKNLENFLFLEKVMNIIKNNDIRPESIEFELTEASLMSDPDSSLLILQKLSDSKIILSIDDFGTGYSALSYLDFFPIDILKIDQSFIRKLSKSPKTGIILEGVIQMAHKLAVRVLAEGIEDGITERQLVAMGCDIGQGYFYSRPVPDTDIIELIKSKNTHAGMVAGFIDSETR